MEKIILFLILSFYFTACTAISFVSEGDHKSSFKAQKNHTKNVSITKTKEFYLWGLVAPNPNVDVDQLLKESGAQTASSVKISVFQTSYQKFVSWLSLGFFIPESYKIDALTLEDY